MKAWSIKCHGNGWSWIFFTFVVVNLFYRAKSEDETISALRGHSVVLTCPVDVTSCGDLHSVKWFKGGQRIAVVSGDGEVVNIDSDFKGRMSIDHSPHGPATRLHIKSVQVTDEDTYVCESTFLEPLESCNNLGAYSIDFTVLVPPSAILILDEEGNQLRNSTTLGPLREGHTLGGTCEVRGTRPVPLVGWYHAGKRLTDTVTIDESNELFLVKSTLSLVLSRQELASIIECRVETPALEHIVSNQLVLDLQVRPTKISLTGVKHHTVQGTRVLLQCQIFGARPAANMTWYNSTKALDADNNPLTSISTKTYLQNDGTFETVSQLIFTATRYENGAAIRCEGDNIVMRDDLEKPIHETLVLEVMYPPVVTVKPDNITVNETEDFLLFCEYEANPATLESVRWRQNEKILKIENIKRYEGGNAEQTALLVKNASRNDIGSYTCELSNAIGNDTSDNVINVDVQYVPTVELDMDPESPIIENHASNVTLYCNVAQGNPTQLLKVRWFLDGQLLKELPECISDDADNDDNELCGIDPSKMLLQNVGRDFYGNYSCEGFNAAGWGPRSKEEELVVYYEPGNATIHHRPHTPVKRKSVTLLCSVDDGGNPNATRFRWLRGDKSVMDVVTPMWTIDPVGLDSRTNFSCYAYNEGGEGNQATVQLDVHAPPAFIQKLPPYTGALYSTPGISLSCRVECVPRCNISWFKDGMGIEEFSDRYYVRDSYLPADPSTGDFESTLSILHFNMSAWPDEKLDIFRDSANYSCVSSNNSIGGGVRSATYFGVEYPPENTTVSNTEISVEEGHQPQRILCSAKAYPEPTYEWRRSGAVIAKGNALIVNRGMQRSDSGPYTCISFNRHGNHSAEAIMNVLFRPNCSIVRREIEDEDTLVCTAYGNPEEVDFHWSLNSENDTIDAYNMREDGINSYMILEDSVLISRTYRCMANNSVGMGSICEIDVAGHVSWWHRLDRMTLLVIIASIFALLLAVIVICIIIICICRKRRRQNKYHTELSKRSTRSVETPPPSPRSEVGEIVNVTINENRDQSSSEVPKSPPKWPLRPGVMVHVKGDTKQNLAASRAQTPSNGRPEVSPGTPAKTPELPLRHSTPKMELEPIAPKAEEEIVDEPNDELVNFTNSGVIERLLRRLRWRRGRCEERNSPPIISPTNSPGQGKIQKKATYLLRAAGWFGSGKSTGSNVGLFDSRRQPSGIKYTDGVVSYKKAPQNACRPVRRDTLVLDESEIVSTEQISNKKKDHDKSSAAGEPLTLTEPGEYENLPFHGMQTAPNKSINPNANSTTSYLTSNVVRVAPRPKDPTTFNSCLHSSTYPTFSANVYPGNSTYNHNFTTNTPNYTTCPTMAVSTSLNPFLVKRENCQGHMEQQRKPEKKFSSLKNLGIKKSPQFYSMRISKNCKRHNSFAAGDAKKPPSFQPAYNNVHREKYEQQPLYENLTDSIQIHESSLQNESSFANVLLSDEFRGNYEGECTSIYRSDSGISNSSYECITPLPAPRTCPRTCQSAPIYMNLPTMGTHGPNQKIQQPNTAFANYERSSQTNPFVLNQQRQQILVPRELFPSQARKSSNRRMIKLPLRKHHSFHFQPTPAGPEVASRNRDNYKHGGPLIFKPLSEKNAFKPITPVPQSPGTPPPRICGTSLKRHVSNVEVHDGGKSCNGSVKNFLHYADLAPLTAKNKKSSSSSGESSEKVQKGDSDESIKLMNLKENKKCSVNKNRNTNTQYAALQFNEVNI